MNPEISGTADVVWVVGKEIPMTRLRKMMLEELQRRNYSEITTRKYLQPQGSHQKRPTVVTSKPANGSGLGLGCFYSAAS